MICMEALPAGSDLYGRTAVICMGGWCSSDCMGGPQRFVWEAATGSGLYGRLAVICMGGWCSSVLYGRLAENCMADAVCVCVCASSVALLRFGLLLHARRRALRRMAAVGARARMTTTTCSHRESASRMGGSHWMVWIKMGRRSDVERRLTSPPGSRRSSSTLHLRSRQQSETSSRSTRVERLAT